MSVLGLARDGVRGLTPYKAAIQVADTVRLNANEAPHDLVADPLWHAMELHRYPPPQPADLRERLATLYGVAEDQLLVTRGSDEGIDLLTRVFCRAGEDAILQCPPAFGMYRIAAQTQGAAVVSVARRG